MRSPNDGGRLSQRKISDIFLSEGMVTREQLEEACQLQKTDDRPLGKILLSLGCLSHEDLARALAKCLNMEYSTLAGIEIDPEVLGIVNEEALLKHKAVPIRLKKGRLVVAMSDPENVYARSDIAISAGYPSRLSSPPTTRCIAYKINSSIAISDPNDIYALEDLRIIARCPITPVVATEEDLEGAFVHLFGADDGLYPEEEVTDIDQLDSEPPLPLEEHREEKNGPEEGGLVLEEGSSPSNEPPGGDGDNRSLARIDDSSKKVAIGGGRIGDILLAEGKITEEQLDRALMMQKDDAREIGKILLSLGYVQEADLGRALARRLRLDFMKLSERDVDNGAATLVDQRVLRKHGAVPLRIESNCLVVAMSDPTNIYALEDLTMITGYAIRPVVALEDEIQRVHNDFF